MKVTQPTNNSGTDINVKFIEVLVNLVREQNMQLIKIIAEEEKLSYLELAKLVPSTYQLKKEMANLEQTTNKTSLPK
jgi:predicted transcriptional regulator